ncbi:EamA family transporter RarD [Sporolactobacillus sp. CPB3-1]|uniref:EamA family transporter RarD n=1 Tax=Sporolactobacillus mangiferae TaxID=2940498 RepID=A0ABT0M9J4_9BACL|nr:EamA family transporter RarD [Sporolactobacillus mangiferae]MCL1631539.1 EamA family transporter RarD [Sporolactobacillus mangiferae]
MTISRRSGILYTFSAFSIWGFLTLYWKWLDSVPSGVVLAHRIVWGFVFMVIVLIMRHELTALKMQLALLWHRPGELFIVTAGSIAISANWLIYVWAVAHAHVIEASLGLYIIPLLSMLTGLLFLKERSGVGAAVSMGLAGTGVLLMTLHYGHVPWLALSLAVTSAVYSLCKKKAVLEAYVGMAVETMLMLPFAVFFLIFYSFQVPESIRTFLHPAGPLLIGAGVLTALPLIWFAEGAKRISLTMIGFFQYMTPTAAFLIGRFVFHERVTSVQLLSFLFIWLSIIVYTGNELVTNKRNRNTHAAHPLTSRR